MKIFVLALSLAFCCASYAQLATPQQMLDYCDETRRMPKDMLNQLQNGPEEATTIISGYGLTIVNGELVWHVGVYSGPKGAPVSPATEAYIKSVFARYTGKRVVVMPMTPASTSFGGDDSAAHYVAPTATPTPSN
jgi:hypothetical protein